VWEVDLTAACHFRLRSGFANHDRPSGGLPAGSGVAVFSFAYLPGAAPFQLQAPRSPPMICPAARRLRMLPRAPRGLNPAMATSAIAWTFALPATAWQRRQPRNVCTEIFQGFTPPEVMLDLPRDRSRRSAQYPRLFSPEPAGSQGYTPPFGRPSCRGRRGLLFRIRGVAAPPNHSALMCRFPD